MKKALRQVSLFNQRALGRKEEYVMKSFMKNPGRPAALLATLGLALILFGCGGGGGNTTPAPPAQVTCPDGTSQTAATAELAKAACAPTTFTVTPANGSSNASPAGLKVVVTSTGKLDASSITAANVSLKAGNVNPVAGTLSVAPDNKSFTFALTGNGNYAQSYTFAAMVKDALGRDVSVNATFTTGLVDCSGTPGTQPNAAGTACEVIPVVPPPDTGTSGGGGEIITPPQACPDPSQTHSDVFGACVWPASVDVLVPVKGMVPAPGTGPLITGGAIPWAKALAEGYVTLSASTATLNGRPIVSALYVDNQNGVPVYIVTALYGDDGKPVTNVFIGSLQKRDWIRGNDLGVLIHDEDGTCWQGFPVDGYTNLMPVACS